MADQAQAWQAVGTDLKTQILELLDQHPARLNSGLVYNVFVDFALTVALNTYGDNARGFWMRSFDVAMAIRRGETMGVGK
jgi:hypothetical protein